MSWLLNKLGNKQSQPKVNLENNVEDPVNIRYEVFKSHWHQLQLVINGQSKKENIVRTNATVVNPSDDVTQDDVDAARNLLEQMIYLLSEEQTSGIPLGPILEFVITHGIFNQLFKWTCRAQEHKQQLLVNQLKIYEVLISQAEPSLLHHKQLVNPLWNTISEAADLCKEEVDAHIVLLLNLLCVWMNRFPTLLEVFFHSTERQGAANFLMFSLLIGYIHREGSVGQQARDALLLCMTLSMENEEVADYIVANSNFCPVLATGLSGLYSSLPRQMEVRADDWHCLSKNDWSHVPALVNFMNSLEFCNVVVEASHEKVSNQLLNYIYNGFLVSVFGPALHKVSTDEVVVTTAYLNLFLRSVTAPSLMKCFLKFLLTHRHDNALIINTLIQRIGSNNRLALVSLSLFRTLLDLNCEDLMLHLIFRYLIPCNHLLASQRHSLCDIDMYNASATRFLRLTPHACVPPKKDKRSDSKESEIFKPIENIQGSSPTPKNSEQDDVMHDRSSGSRMVDLTSNHSPHGSRTASESSIHAVIESTPHAVTEYTVNEDLSVTLNMHQEEISLPAAQPEIVQSPHTMAEFGSDLQSQIDLNTSYMDYLEDAKIQIEDCRNACEDWSAAYDGENPSPDSVQSDVAGKIIITDPHHTSSLSLSTTTDDMVPRLHAQSDPVPSHSADPALKALNATYQALNLTAIAFSTPTTNTKTEILDSNPVVNESQDNKATENGHQDADIQLDSEQTASDKTDLVMKPEEQIIEIIDTTTTTPNNLAHKETTKSSVDDFFRSLMESVPKSMIEKKSTQDDTALQPEVVLNGESDVTLDKMKTDNEFSEDDKENNPSTYHKNDSDDEMSYENSLEDDDWESSDNISFASTSFYESEMEYVPTEQSLAPLTPIKMHGAPYTGPFLSTLFGKLEVMVGNSLYENLLLTGIVSRLACYTQPLLRSFLLNTQMVFHPSVRSLYQVLNTARFKIDKCSETVIDFDILLHRAQKYLLARGKLPLSGSAQERSLIQDQPMPVPSVKTKRNTILGDVFMRRKNKVKKKRSGTGIAPLDTLIEKGTQKLRSTSILSENQSSKFYVSQKSEQRREDNKAQEMRTKNAVYASIVLTEFLKELAAISQEHAVSPDVWHD